MLVAPQNLPREAQSGSLRQEPGKVSQQRESRLYELLVTLTLEPSEIVRAPATETETETETEEGITFQD